MMQSERCSAVRVVVAAAGCLMIAAATWAQSSLPRVLVWEQAIQGSEEQEMRWPVAAAVRSADEVAVAVAREPRLLIFRKVGVSWRLDRSVDLPAVPADLVWDGSRYVASLRQGYGLVAVEADDGGLSPLPLPEGVVAGPLAALGARRLLVYDHAGKRVLEIDAAGAVRKEVVIDPAPAGLVATASGGFYAAIAQASELRRYDAAGSLEASWEVPGMAPIPAWPVAVTVDPGGTVAVVDRHGGRILVFDNEGRIVGSGSRRGREPGLLFLPAAMTRLPDGTLMVVDQGNDRTQLFRRTDLTSSQ